MDKTKWSCLLAKTCALILHIFFIQYLIKGLKSYWDFQEIGPKDWGFPYGYFVCKHWLLQ